MAASQTDRLCDVLLLNIFSYLDVRSKACCRAVCRLWRRVASDWRLWEDIDIGSVSELAPTAYKRSLHRQQASKNMSEGNGFATKAFLLCVPLSGRVRSLSLVGCTVNLASLTELARACPQLRELDLGEAYICESHEEEDSSISWTGNSTSKVFSSSLRSISLRATSLPPSIFVDLWETASAGQLAKLDLRAVQPRCADGRLQCRMQMQLLLSSCTDLEALDISEISWVTDRMLRDALRTTSWPKLQSLAMSK